MDRPYELPPFDEHGNLPAKDYWPSQNEFEQRFVYVESSTTRRRIYQGFQRHRAELLDGGVDGKAKCMLDGSYTTRKLDPEDLDLVVEVNAYTYEDNIRLQELLSGRKVKAEFFCDAYPLLILPADHPDYHRVTQLGREYWLKWFGRDRGGNPKGRVWTRVEGFR